MNDLSPEDSQLKDTPTTGETALKPAGKKVCSACGTINYPSSVYCYKCGVELPSEVDDTVQPLGNPAGFWVRFLAFTIDRIFLTIIGFTIAITFTGAPLGEVLSRYFDPDIPFSGGEYLISLGIEIAYWTLTIGAWGKTIGKAMLRLKVTRVDGSKITYTRSFARYWAYYLSVFTLGLGFITIALSSKKRGLHDFICNTKVLKLEV